jgi:hypothetical protein
VGQRSGDQEVGRLHEEVLPGWQPDRPVEHLRYTVASTLHQVLKQAGDNLTRENIMKQAASMKGLLHRYDAAGH